MAINLVWNDVDISERVSSITWSGSVTEAARRLEFSVAHGPQDFYLQTLDIDCGDKIKFYENGKEWFRGTVVVRNKSSVNGTLDYTAYDDIFYLNRNKTSYNFGSLPAEEITRRVLTDHKFSVGQLAVTDLPISLLSNDLTLYDIIMAAYTKASKQNGQLYGIVSREGKMHVYQRGWIVADFTISEDENLTESSFSESIENMVNTVKIADSTGAQVGYVQNAEWLNKYGAMKEIVYPQDGIDTASAANALLKGPERSSSVTAIGNSFCLFGNSVKIKNTATGLVGVFAIESDSHTFENGTHMMSLDLMFTAYMDEREGQESNNGSGGEEKGTTVQALFTAYYPANNKMEGGFYDAMGNRLDPSQNTCAAPKNIPFGTKIKILGTGTDKDGQVYTVTDRGGAITVANGVYHFDLLMSNSAQCNNWGRVNGQALIIDESSDVGDSSTSTGGDTGTVDGDGGGITATVYDYPMRGKFIKGTIFGKRGKTWKCGYHTGQDYSAISNNGIYAITNGKVISAKNSGSYGNCVMIKHSDGHISLYAHLSKIFVSVGQSVTKNTKIGTQGSTGKTYGAHLHFEIHKGSFSYPAKINPDKWLRERIGK